MIRAGASGAMATAGGRAELKKVLLDLLREDEEFRLAVAGLIGLGEVLGELRKLREDFQRFAAEQERRWEENNRRCMEQEKRWEENNRRWEENNRRWEEAYRRFEAIEEELRKLREDFLAFVKEQEKRWEENNRRWEENNKRWEEANRRFEAIERTLADHSEKIAILAKRVEELASAVDVLSRAVGELRVAIGSMGRRMGRDLERLVLELYRDAIQRFGVDVERVEKISLRDEEGKYLHRGARLELDVYMSDGTAYLIEVKSLADEEDVRWFNYKADAFVKELRPQSYKKIIVAVNITREALEAARELGIDAVYGSVVE
ncbi:MAG: DUF3782 domain-containing protein [Desulfurococcaceae archaeon]